MKQLWTYCRKNIQVPKEARNTDSCLKFLIFQTWQPHSVKKQKIKQKNIVTAGPWVAYTMSCANQEKKHPSGQLEQEKTPSADVPSQKVPLSSCSPRCWLNEGVLAGFQPALACWLGAPRTYTPHSCRQRSCGRQVGLYKPDSAPGPQVHKLWMMEEVAGEQGSQQKLQVYPC